MATSSGPKTASTKAAIDTWRTAITGVEPNKILIRGYPIDELMGRLSFGDAVYLLLVGDMPSRTVSRIMEALLVSSIDHGAIPPSTIAARTVAGTGAPLRTAAAAGVLALGSPLGGGGSIEACMRFLNDGIALVGDWVSYDDVARRLLDQREGTGQLPPGYCLLYTSPSPRDGLLSRMPSSA